MAHREPAPVASVWTGNVWEKLVLETGLSVFLEAGHPFLGAFVCLGDAI